MGRLRLIAFVAATCLLQNSLTEAKTSQVCDLPYIGLHSKSTCEVNYEGTEVCEFVCQEGFQFADSVDGKPRYSCIDGRWEPSLETKHCIRVEENSGQQHVPESVFFPSSDEKRSDHADVCFAWGKSSYHTFDGLIYTFEGHCSYKLAGDCEDNTFSIIVNNNCEDGVCTRSITIFVSTTQLTLERLSNGEISARTETQSIAVPGMAHGFIFEKVAQYLKVKSGIGFKLKWDGQDAVFIEMDSDMANKTCGLCGNYNGVSADDMTDIHGSVRKSVTAFGNSWVMSTEGSYCADAVLVHHCQRTTPAVYQLAKNMCQKIVYEPAFSLCRNLVPVFPYYELCLEEVCANEAAVDSVCPTFQAYFRECHRRGGNVQWRSNELCPVTCPAGMVYNDCGSSCPKTCRNTLYDCENEHCVDGCHCPEGKVLNDGQCVDQEACPCVAYGKTYQSGKTIRQDCNKCKCLGGRWNCTTNECGGVCKVICNSHYTTFDGKLYHFLGNCNYVLATGNANYFCRDTLPSEHYSVEYENVNCEENVFSTTCSTSLTVRYQNHVLRLKRDFEVLMDDVFVKLLPFKDHGFLIRKTSSLMIKVELGNGLVVFWDGVSRVYLHAPPSLFDKTQGMCGTFNKNRQDDFLTRHGDIETNVAAFGNKWKTLPSCEDSIIGTDSLACDLFPQRKASAEAFCMRLSLSPFSACHNLVEVGSFIAKCTEMVCLSGEDSNMVCDIFADYARSCSSHGLILNWMDYVPKCSVSCPGDTVYQQCGTACGGSCDSVNLNQTTCLETCVEGCSCPNGLLLDYDGKSCVESSNCGCKKNDKIYSVGSTLRDGCQLCMCLDGDWKCDDIPGLCENTVCPVNMHWEACKSGCVETCENFGQSLECVTETCLPGCACDNGTVWDGENCVTLDSCPCHHGGKTYQVGEAIKMDCQTCFCSGQSWTCDGIECLGECSSFGDQHYKTFDGRRFDFQGSCEYVMVRNVDESNYNFNVTVENVLCGTSGVSCTKKINIAAEDENGFQHVLTLGHTDSLSRLRYNPSFEVWNAGAWLFVKNEYVGLHLKWDRKTRIFVTLETRHKEKVEGLCGNYNGNENDDFKIPGGGPAEQKPYVFGNSWQVHSYCPEAIEINDTCLFFPQRQTWAHKKCSVIKSEVFGACHSLVDPQEWYQMCVYDACGCDSGGDCECVCTAVAAYAQECSKVGSHIEWRSNDFCPMMCGDCPMNYQTCTSACPKTCHNVNYYDMVEASCTQPCVEGCACPEGMVLDDTGTTCINISECQYCMEIDGVRYQEGDIIRSLSDGCRTCFCSQSSVHCLGQSCSTTPPIVTTSKPIVNETTVPDFTTRPGVVSTTQAPTTATVSTFAPRCIRTGWTGWMNSYYPTLTNAGDIETIENLRSFYQFCEESMIARAECRVVNVHYDSSAAGEEVSCGTQGLVCYNHQQRTNPPLCLDYEIRLFCQCSEEFTTTSSVEQPTTKPSIGEETTTVVVGEVTTTPGVGEVTTTPGVGEVTTKPGVGEVTTTPGLGEVTTTPGVGEITTTPGVEEVTTTPGVGEVTTTPGVGEVTTKPGVGEVTTTPGVGEVTTTPGVGEVTTTPGVGEVTTTPGVGEITTTPIVREGTTTPGVGEVTTTPGVGEVTTTPGVGEVTTTPGVGEVTTTPGVGEVTTTPGVREVTTTPGVGEVTTTPGVGEVTTTPGVGEVTTTPGVEEVTTTPGVGEVTTTPGVGEVTTTPGVREVTTTPGVGEVTTTPGVGEVTTTPGVGEVTTTPGVEEVTTTPGVGEVTTTPGVGEVTTTPGVGEVTTTPGVGEVTTTPGVGEVTTTPGVGEVTTTPGVGEVITTPGVGEVTTTPGVGEVTTTPGVGEVTTTLDVGEVTTTPGLCRPGWTVWLNANHSNSDGDVENLEELSKLYNVCRYPQMVECQTSDGLMYESTKQEVTCDATIGLTCLNERNNSPCLDYKIRIFCNCEDVITTTLTTTETVSTPCDEYSEWMSSSQPALENKGDIESFSNLRANYDVCAKPSSIECREIATKVPVSETKQRGVTCDLSHGLSCMNELQDSGLCEDFEVRVYCPCKFVLLTTPYVTATPTGSPSPNTTATKGTTTTSPILVTSTTSSVEEPATTPSVERPETTPSVEEPGTTPLVVVSSTTPSVKKPTTTPSAEEPETTPSVEEPETTPSVEEPETTPSVEEPSTPSVGEPTTALPADKSTTKPPIIVSSTTPRMESTTTGSRCDSPLDMTLQGDYFKVTFSSKRVEITLVGIKLDSATQWTAKLNNRYQSVTFEFDRLREVTGITTQGSADGQSWVTAYTMSYSNDGQTYAPYTDENDSTKVFEANFDANTRKSKLLEIGHSIKAKWLRIKPTSWHESISMRIELLVPCGDEVTPTPEVTTRICGDGFEWQTCAFNCNQYCHYMEKLTEDVCENTDQCIAGCKPINGSEMCKQGWKLDQNKNCVKTEDCGCFYKGKYLPPGRIEYSPNERCMCFNNKLSCTAVSTTTQPLTTTPEPTTISTTPYDECIWWGDFHSMQLPSSLDGDEIEDIKDHIRESACKSPVAIDCRVKGHDVSYDRSGQNGVTCDLEQGLRCYGNQLKGLIPKCFDYELRLGCFNESCATTVVFTTESGVAISTTGAEGTSTPSTSTEQVISTSSATSPQPCPNMPVDNSCLQCEQGEYCYNGTCIAGDLCPCVIDGKVHAEGSMWRSSDCQTCTCFANAPKCSPITCDVNGYADCNKLETYIKYEGDCCGTCECICGLQEFACPGDSCNCVPNTFRCDGIPDCNDGFDEKNCNDTSSQTTVAFSQEITSTSTMPIISETTVVPGTLPTDQPGVTTTAKQPPVTEGTKVPGTLPPDQPGVTTTAKQPPITEGTNVPGTLPTDQPGVTTTAKQPPVTEGTNVPGTLPTDQPGVTTTAKQPQITEGTNVPGTLPTDQPGVTTTAKQPPVTEGTNVPGTLPTDQPVVTTTAKQPPITEGTNVPGTLPPDQPGVTTTAKQPPITEGTNVPGTLPTDQPGVTTTAKQPPITEGTNVPGTLPTDQPGVTTTAKQPPDTEGTNVPGTLPTDQPGVTTTAKQPPITEGTNVPGTLPPDQPGVTTTAKQPPVTEGTNVPGTLPTDQPGVTTTAKQPPVTEGTKVPGTLPTGQPGVTTTANQPSVTEGTKVPGTLPTDQPGVTTTAKQPPDTEGTKVPGTLPPDQPGVTTTAKQPPVTEGTNVPGTLPTDQPGVTTTAKQPPITEGTKVPESTVPVETTPSYGCMYGSSYFPFGGFRKFYKDCGVCTCMPDSTWSCDSSSCSSECVMLAGSSFLTFDLFAYDYEICTHILAKDCANETFEIIAISDCENRDRLGRCSKSLDITTGFINVILYDANNLLLNDIPYKLNYLKVFPKRPDFAILYAGGEVIVETNNFKIYWKTVTREARVVVDNSMTGRMCGLCSNADKDSSNDLQLPNMELVESVQEFGDSWSATDETCDSEPTDCTIEQQAQHKAQCSELWNGVFATCHSVVSVEEFIPTCVSSMCDCMNSTFEQDCRCGALAEYAEKCQRLLGEPVKSWRYLTNCEPTCPPGKVWKECGSACPKTCQNMMTYEEAVAAEECQRDCVSGCFCPEGQVLDGDQCIEPDDCNECTCIGWGDPHYLTYDKKYYAFQGNCTYILSRPQGNSLQRQEDDFIVLGHNEYCTVDPVTSCTKAVSVIYRGHTVTLNLNGKVLHNKREVTLPFGIDGISVRSQLLKLVLKIEEIKLYVEFDEANHGFAVQIPIYRYFNSTEGLCGNCNKDKEDDYIQRDGQLTKDINTFAYSWFEEYEEECFPTDGPPCTPGDPGCCIDDADVSVCDIIKSDTFKNCLYAVDPENFFNSCVYDVCSGNGGCDAIAAYAEACKKKEVCVEWRTEELCPFNCSAELQYQECGDSCLATCGNVTKCNINGGCFCPDGLLYFGGECIEQKDCPVCVDKNGMPHKEDEEWQMNGDPCGPTCHCEDGEPLCWAVGCPIARVMCNDGEKVVYKNDSSGCCQYPDCAPCEESDCTEPVAMPMCIGTGIQLIKTWKECCPQYDCVCNSSTCPPLEIPSCPYGQVPHLSPMNESGCCSQYKCECPSTCPPSNVPDPLPFGKKVTVENEDWCCPTQVVECDYEMCDDDTTIECSVPMSAVSYVDANNTCCSVTECVCNSTLCDGSQPQCSQHQSLLVSRPPGACCGEYSCACNASTCPPLVTPECTKGQVAVKVEMDECCSEYECQCPSTCPPDDIPNPLPVGMKVSLENEDWCCPTRVLVCDYDQCSENTITCNPPMAPVIMKDPNNTCCSLTQCQCNSSLCDPVEPVCQPHQVVSVTRQPGACCNQLSCECDVSTCPASVVCEGKYEVLVQGDMNTCCGREETCQCNCPAAPTCNLGFTLQQTSFDQSCNCTEYECVLDKCVVNDTEIEIGEKFEENACTSCYCGSAFGNPVAVCSETICPEVTETCPEEFLVLSENGCCMKCNEPLREGCRPQVVRSIHLESEDCRSNEPVNVTQCLGNCESSTSYSLAKSMLDKQCGCCSAVEVEPIFVTLHCGNGTEITREHKIIKSCDCEASQCASQEPQN